MTTQTQAVMDEAMTLPPVDRAGLIEQLLASFDRDSRHTIDKAWAKEVELRLDAYERGETSVVSLEEARIDAVVIGKAFFEGKISLDELARWNDR